MIFCLDTDVLSAWGRQQPPLGLVRRLGALAPGEVCTTAINLAEITYGLLRQGDSQLAARMSQIISRAGPVVSFDVAAADVYATIRVELESSGRGLAEPDLRIAAIAIANNLTLVSGNGKHFSRVPDLRLENWLDG